MASSGLLQRVGYSLRRRGQILSCPHLDWPTRLRVAVSRHANPTPAARRLVRHEDGKLSVAIDGYSFSIAAPDEPDERRWWRAEGFSQIIAETFFYPVLYRGQVRPRPGDTVFDVGGNIGTTAAVFSRAVGPGGKVYAFEPGVEQVLRRHVEANGLANVEVVPVAVGDKEGEVGLNMDMDGLGIDSSIAYKKEGQEKKKIVPMETLDHFVASRGIDRVDYIKMDIEGAEELAIRGAAEVVKKFRPKWSISSYHNDFAGERQHPKLVALLKGHGYHIHEVPYFHIYAW